MSNSAFDNDAGAEAKRIISELEIPDIPGWHQNLLDINGNKVGEARTTN
jgi:hypothetical protein